MQRIDASHLVAKVALVFGVATCLGWTFGPKTVAVGITAPDFAARSYVTGDKTRLSDQRGKVVILTFWATWCAPCRKELPNLEGIQDKVGKDQLVVLAVNFRDTDDTLRTLKMDSRVATWKITLLEDHNGSVASRYAIDSIPHLFLIGRNGTILAVHSGFGDGSIDEMLPEINAALADKPMPQS